MFFLLHTYIESPADFAEQTFPYSITKKNIGTRIFID
jgi:hypothetical protein